MNRIGFIKASWPLFKSPAYAGMNRKCYADVHLINQKPRVCGDEPRDAGRQEADPRKSPAYAGMNRM